MSSPLDTRLDRQEGRRAAGAAEQSSAAIRRRHTWRADSDDPAAEDCAAGDAFKPKILALARGFADAPPPNFAKASFAELFAWSLAQPPAE